MIKVSKKKFETIYKFYKICGNDKFMIVKKYSKGWGKSYLEDLTEPFIGLIDGIIKILLSPIELIVVLYSFIPKIVVIDESIEDVKHHPEGQFHFDKCED